MKDEFDAYDLAKRALEYMGFDPEEEEKKSQEQHEKGKEKGKEKGDDEGTGDGAKPADGEGEPEDGGAEAEGGDGEGEGIGDRAKEFWAKYHHKPDMKFDDDAEGKADAHLEYDELRGSAGEQYVVRTPTVYRWGDAEHRDKTPRRSYQEAHGASSFANQVRKLLQVMSLSRKEPNKRRGKLRTSSLYRTSMADTRVFSQQVQSMSMDCAVSLAVDFSGSMGGSKIKHAVHAAQLVNAAIARLGVPVEIWGFSDNSQGPKEYRIKDYDERVSGEEITRRMGFGNMQNNDDANSILFAWQRLVKRKEPRKVMIVMSDGSPASSGPCDPWGMLVKVLKDIKEDGRVKMYGVGILDTNVEDLYEHRTVISKGSEIEDKLLEVMKQQVIG
jgi:cobalamin biosynthesis protein CobT